MKSTLKNENTPGGRAFKVTITETYQRTVTIYESEMKEPTVEEAQRVASALINQGKRVIYTIPPDKSGENRRERLK